jgi:isopentenyldiphosphate isomerase
MSGSAFDRLVRPFKLDGKPPRFVTEPAPQFEWTDQHEKVWTRLCAANPRLHDGPIWSVSRANSSEVVVHADRYKRLAVQSDESIGNLGVRQLGVKGLTVSADQAGAQRVLIARRGWRVRTYPCEWEIAPAGGVGAGVPLSVESVLSALGAEAREELGITVDASSSAARFIAVIEDDTASSVEIIVRLFWPAPFDAAWKMPESREAAWEYSAAKWLTSDDVWFTLDDRSGEPLTPPTRWVLQSLKRLLE